MREQGLRWLSLGIALLLVAGTIERTDDHLTADLTLMETEGEATRPLGEGVWPIWVPP